MPPLHAHLLSGMELYREVVLKRIAAARESVWISTANVKEMYVEDTGPGRYRSILDLFADLAGRGVELRLLHAELPSRPFRASFDRLKALWSGGLHLKICPRVHFKTVIVDGAWSRLSTLMSLLNVPALTKSMAVSVPSEGSNWGIVNPWVQSVEVKGTEAERTRVVGVVLIVLSVANW